MATLPNPPETVEDQQFIVNEFQRANALMIKLSEKQQTVSVKKMGLEKQIMAKQGVEDGDLWKELIQARSEIDGLGTEKCMLVAKLYNLAQKFVQELDVATEETSRQMMQSNHRQDQRTTQVEQMMLNSMRSTPESRYQKAGKQYETELLEPQMGENFPDKLGRGDSLMSAVGAGGNQKRQRNGQQRASDGKFESGFGMTATAPTGAGNRKGANYSNFEMGGKGDSMPVGGGGGGRKTGGRKRGGGGNVEKHFYDADLQSSQENMLTSSMSGKFGTSDGLDALTGGMNPDEEAKGMLVDPLAGSMGLADNGMNADEGVCKKCNKPRPPPDELSNDDNLVWVGCDKCPSWFHSVCIVDKLRDMGLTNYSQEALDGIDFICQECEEEAA